MASVQTNVQHQMSELRDLKVEADIDEERRKGLL
jgi:hypothetical protein